MKAYVLVPRLLALRWPLVRQAVRRSSNNHHPVNPGPPCTYDYVPIPHQPYKVVYSELQKKFNTYLAISTALLATSIACAAYYDLWSFDAWRAPKSWYERKNQ